MNPYNSPWNKPRINDKKLWFRWNAIEKYLTTKPTVIEGRGFLEINGICYIAKNKSKMRLKGQLDWCHYTAKTLANAIDTSTIESYYELMLKDFRSDPNVWGDHDFEMKLKSRYASRLGKASLI